jgi:glycosyltransferase involved in cell wall biosynthesis
MWKQSAVSNRAVFLSPEPPYPLTGGGALRSASLLHFLAQRFRVHLLTYVEEGSPNPEPFLPKGLVDHITTIYLPSHDKGTVSRIYRNTGRLIRGKLPLDDRFTQPESVHRVALATVGQRYEVAVVEHFWCARYLDLLRTRARHVVLDLHNVESVLHEACSRTEPWPHKIGHRLFLRTARRLERSLLAEFDLVLVTSEADRQRVLERSPRARVAVYPNALPLRAVPRTAEEEIIAFSGNLEYHPNINAVRYFHKEVWPLLKAAYPRLRWRLIGKNETAVRGMFGEDPRVEFTGPVEDAIEELARARVVVVPLLAGSGTRIKILEAWAAGRPVVSTPIGAEGLPARDGENIRIVRGPRQTAEAVLELLADTPQRERLGRAGRATYEAGFCWSAAWETLETPFDSLLSVSPMVAAI